MTRLPRRYGAEISFEHAGRRLITVFQSRLEFGDGLYVPRNLSNASNFCSSFSRGKRIVSRLRGTVVIAFKDTFGAYERTFLRDTKKLSFSPPSFAVSVWREPGERVGRKERLQRPGICDAQLTKGFSPLLLGHATTFPSSFPSAAA